ncbi:MAG: hypothetical protein JWO07_481 [Candidatus Saccharibacteria bacterium]|nr:hypothetical protein [Candidatus Saccharibacteria bacterium]
MEAFCTTLAAIICGIVVLWFAIRKIPQPRILYVATAYVVILTALVQYYSLGMFAPLYFGFGMVPLGAGLWVWGLWRCNQDKHEPLN